MDMRVRNNYILIEDITDNIIKTSGGLEIASDQEHVRYKKAKVLLVGNKIDDLNVGEVLLYDGNNSNPVRIDGDVKYIIHEGQVVIVYDKDE